MFLLLHVTDETQFCLYQMKNLSTHNYNGIDATIIADSIFNGKRLTSYVLTFPRIVLAEFNTHRKFSRNSASSRAIPFKKMVEKAKSHPFIPLGFQKDHTGMQGSEYFEGEEKEKIIEMWLKGRDSAVERATALYEAGVTKQLCNRPLETYMYHTVIMTSSQFENFFYLRANEQAEIHIAKLAEIMLCEYNCSTPKKLKAGQWHIPFGDNIDPKKVDKVLEFWGEEEGDKITELDVRTSVAVARCARVSYMNFDGSDDYLSDVNLCSRLMSSGHFSPFEHVAMAINDPDVPTSNFDNCWYQLRKDNASENKNDNRVLRHS